MVVLNAQGEVVAGLWFEVCVAKEKIGAVHVAHILVVELFRSRGFETLAPCGAETQIIPLDHCGHLWREMPTELFVTVEAQSCCHIEPLHRSVFVLHVKSAGVVCRLASFHAGGRFEPVVPPFDARAETVLIG